MRDLDKQPYSADEARVAKFFFDAGIGGGDDPIGNIIASHQALAAERNEWKQAAGVEAGLRREFREKAEKATLAERARCAQIAEAIDSGRGNEKLIVATILEGDT